MKRVNVEGRKKQSSLCDFGDSFMAVSPLLGCLPGWLVVFFPGKSWAVVVALVAFFLSMPAGFLVAMFCDSPTGDRLNDRLCDWSKVVGRWCRAIIRKAT